MPLIVLDKKLAKVDNAQAIPLRKPIITYKKFDKMQTKASSSDEEICQVGQTSNHLLNAIVYAYNYHKTLRLSPDDILQCLIITVSSCMSENAEKLRNVFVNFEGQIQLSSFENGNINHVNWNSLVDQLSQEIDKNVKVDLGLDSNFTTSTTVTRTTAKIGKMAVFSKYFTYRMVCMCGIPNVDLMGTLEDWQKLRSKAAHCIRIFNEHGHLINWGKHFLNVINRIIETYQGNVSKVFWSRIIYYIPYGSGSDKLVSGWAKVLVPGELYDQFPTTLHLLDDRSVTPTYKTYKHHLEEEMAKWAGLCEEAPLSYTTVDVKFDDHGTIYDMKFAAGHIGWNCKDDVVYPVIGWVGNACLESENKPTPRGAGPATVEDFLEERWEMEEEERKKKANGEQDEDDAEILNAEKNNEDENDEDTNHKSRRFSCMIL